MFSYKFVEDYIYLNCLDLIYIYDILIFVSISFLIYEYMSILANSIYFNLNPFPEMPFTISVGNFFL